jgi:outer membrane protein OmpA-like peptidoglycan-associated protein
MDPRGSDPRDQKLSDRRVSAVRDALIQAGVPASKIEMGAFGDTRLVRDRRLEVLIKTANYGDVSVEKSRPRRTRGEILFVSTLLS